MTSFKLYAARAALVTAVAASGIAVAQTSPPPNDRTGTPAPITSPATPKPAPMSARAASAPIDDRKGASAPMTDPASPKPAKPSAAMKQAEGASSPMGTKR